MINIKLLKERKIIEESLTRMGIANEKRRVIYPSCYLVEDGDEFFISHFKEIYMKYKENSYNNLTEDDVIRRDTIVRFLWDWGLVEVVDEISSDIDYVYVLPFREKRNWIISHKVNFRKLVNESI